MIILDTGVLIYAVGEEHPLREPCCRLIAAQGDGGVDAAHYHGVFLRNASNCLSNSSTTAAAFCRLRASRSR